MADGAAAAAAEAPPPTTGRVIAALVVGQLGLHSVMAGMRLAMPLQMLREGRTAWAVGLLLALFAVAPVLTALPAGRYADRWGYHRPVAGAALCTWAGAALAFASTFAAGAGQPLLLALAALAAGAGSNTGMLTIQRTAGLAARDAVERVRVFSWLGVAPSFSNVIGPVAVGFAIDASGFRTGYGLLLALPLLTLAVARAVPRLPLRAAPAPEPGRRAWHLLREPRLRRLMAVNWLLSSCWDVHTFAVPLIGHQRGLAAATIGLVLGSFTLTVTLVRLAIPLLAARLDERRVLTVAMVTTGAVFVAYPLAPTALAMGGCAVLLGVSLGSVQPMVMSMLHRFTPDHRHGEALALRSMALNGSSTLMPLLFGAAGATVGAAVLFWTIGAAVALGATLVRRLGPR